MPSSRAEATRRNTLSGVCTIRFSTAARYVSIHSRTVGMAYACLAAPVAAPYTPRAPAASGMEIPASRAKVRTRSAISASTPGMTSSTSSRSQSEYVAVNAPGSGGIGPSPAAVRDGRTASCARCRYLRRAAVVRFAMRRSHRSSSMVSTYSLMAASPVPAGLGTRNDADWPGSGLPRAGCPASRACPRLGRIHAHAAPPPA